MRRFRFNKRITKILLVLFILGLAINYKFGKSIFTTNLDTRPLQVGVVGALTGIQPTTAQEHQEKLIASALYEGLVAYDDGATLKPVLADKWSYAKDGKSLSFKLKKNIHFHSGKKLTAADIKSAWERNFRSTKEWSNFNMLNGIVGVKDFINGKQQGINGIVATDKDTLIINFNRPNYAFVYSLTNPLFWVNEAAPKVEQLPAGTGPYCVQERDLNKINLIRNDNYYNGKPSLTAIQVQCYPDAAAGFADYKAGKLDYLDQIPVAEMESLSGNEEYKDRLIKKPVLEFYFLGFNLNRQPYINNYLLRRALNYTVDRQAIIKNVFGGGYIEAKGAIPEGIPGHRQEIIGYSYNDGRARSLLEEAGYPPDKTVPELTLTTNKGSGHLAVGNELQEQFSALGIPLQIQENDWEYYKKQLPRMGMSFFRISWLADYPDADNFLYSLFHSSNIGISNFSGYRNPQVDKLLDDSRAESNQEKRIALLQKAEEIILDDAPHLWLFQKEAAKIIGPDVKGFNMNCMEMVDWAKIELVKPTLEEPDKDK